MSRGMKIYAAALSIIGLVILFNIFYVPANVREINAMLKDDPQLSAYPYPFRVLRIENGVAFVTSPRSAEVPVPMVIGIIDPALKGVSVSDERYFAAQQRLADLQALARERVLASPEVSRVNWQLDEAWLQSNGLVLPN